MEALNPTMTTQPSEIVFQGLLLSGCLLVGGLLLRSLYRRQTLEVNLESKPASTEPAIDLNRLDEQFQQLAAGLSAPNKFIRIVYGTTTNTCKKIAASLEVYLQSHGLDVEVADLGEYDQDNLEQEEVLIAIVSTWTGGTPPEKARGFYAWLKDMSQDFRVDKATFLGGLRFAVLGLGNSDYAKDYCKAALDLDSMLGQLGGKRIAAVVKCDDSTDVEKDILEWRKRITDGLGVKKVEEEEIVVEAAACGDVSGCESGEDVEDEDLVNDVFLEMDAEKERDIGDLEDLTFAETSREMLTKRQRKALTKEGYKVIGSHSAVKLCRWTKHQLRGRGGCYKHTFYGITSYQCMEATPSLACANKCVFCWRHHKNPVGKEWRWKMDPPEQIVSEAIELHRQMIKTMRGVPGVKPERFQEAFDVQHCALSLVGEPIMYPKINELVGDLHRRKISTFLVTNAQFPRAIETLDPVTQLYVSVDAATKDALKAVDRPLFGDFWERFQASLKSLKAKGQRTVYRLTLVKQWNMEEAEDEDEMLQYAKLITLGEPDLIEIKAVTYCGKSDASSLTMENVPWHREVRRFAEALCKHTGGKYGCACEHVHSCCTLLAKKDTFLVNNEWHTWIDYPKFHRLMQEYYESNGTKEFRTADYVAKTPSWALWGAKEEGFDPVETRFRRSRKNKAMHK